MYIALSQENNFNLLSIITVDDSGFLYDPTLVEFKINDLSSGSATQVYPSSGYQNVTADGRYDKGMFYATSSAQQGWTPSGNTGKHNIIWRYKSKDDSITKTITINFYVSDAVFAVNFQTYISPNELRSEGLTTSQCSDDRLLDLILRAQQYIDSTTRQVFRPVQQSFKIDGNETHTLFLPLPIIGIDFVKANHNPAEMSQTSLAIYANKVYDSSHYQPVRDYRQNPRIALFADQTLYNGAFIEDSSVFAVGRLNQHIKGVFGYLESDGTCPRLIKYAAKKLVYSTAKKLSLSSMSSTVAGPIKKEKVDRHEIEYADTTSQTTAATALSSSPDVEEILQRYRAPIGISAASPLTSSRRAAY